MLVAVVPAYNEEKNIGPVVRGLFNQVDKVLVVDDGSNDNTVTLAQSLGAIVLQHEINRGQGAALQTGHDYALKIGADFVLDFDADGQHEPADIRPAWEELKNKNAGILFGSRFMGQISNLPFTKKYIIMPIGRLVNWLYGSVNLVDAQNGFRLYTRSALEKINITQDGMAHATEIQTQVKKLGLKYIEFPIKVVYREYGQGIGGGVKIVKDLFIGRFTK